MTVVHPRARVHALISTPVGDEVVVLDRDADTAHALNATVAAVWRACDGTRSAEAIAAECELDPATVHDALVELDTAALLEGADGMPRREMLSRVARAGGAAALAAPILTVALPAAQAAASTPPTVTVSGIANASAYLAVTSTAGGGLPLAPNGIVYSDFAGHLSTSQPAAPYVLITNNPGGHEIVFAIQGGSSADSLLYTYTDTTTPGNSVPTTPLTGTSGSNIADCFYTNNDMVTLTLTNFTT